MWGLPGPGLEPLSPALAGGFLTTVPPGKSKVHFNISLIQPYLGREMCCQKITYDTLKLNIKGFSIVSCSGLFRPRLPSKGLGNQGLYGCIPFAQTRNEPSSAGPESRPEKDLLIK